MVIVIVVDDLGFSVNLSIEGVIVPGFLLLLSLVVGLFMFFLFFFFMDLFFFGLF